MKRLVSKYGTDSRFPYWSGATLDRSFFNGATAFALVVNWAMTAFVHYDQIGPSDAATSDIALVAHMITAIATALVTARLIHHDDHFVQRFTRIFACGLPIAASLFVAVGRVISV